MLSINDVLFSVDDFSEVIDEEIDGGKMTPTSDGKNVILTFKNSVFTLKLKGPEYKWIQKKDLSIPRQHHVQFLVEGSMIQC